jgi:hypothetical protein
MAAIRDEGSTSPLAKANEATKEEAKRPARESIAAAMGLGKISLGAGSAAGEFWVGSFMVWVSFSESERIHERPTCIS